MWQEPADVPFNDKKAMLLLKLRTFHVSHLIHTYIVQLIFKKPLEYTHYFHFIDEKTRAQRHFRTNTASVLHSIRLMPKPVFCIAGLGEQSLVR